MKKVFAVFILLCFLICLLPIRPAKADSFPSEFFVNSEVYYSAEEMFMAYTDLSEVQREICAYLLGMYNLMYLGSRGFQFSAGAYTSESSFIAKIKSFGYRFLQGAAEIALKSRMDAEFCKYASACILYSSQCNVQSFDDWFVNLDDDFIIPVDQGILNSFTLLYNDNSDLGIGTYGDAQSPWNSGTIQDFGFNTGFTWANSTHQNNFDNYVLNNPPYIFTPKVQFSGTGNYQYIQGSASRYDDFPNALYILRSNSGYSSYRYGYIDVSGNAASYSIITNQKYYQGEIKSQNSLLVCNISTLSYKSSIFNAPNNSDLSDFIYYVFNNNSPLYNVSQANCTFTGNYPLIQHVFLVDNLNTLSNPEEVFNNDSWDIIGIGGNMIVPVDTVGIKPKVITTINLPDNTSNNVEIQDIINENNTVDDNGDPVNPWQITIVVQPNDTNPISIDVNMFSSAKVYIQYLWENATAFLGYCKDLLDCFAFTDVNGADYGPKYAIYGVIVLGVASGLIAKFLL